LNDSLLDRFTFDGAYTTEPVRMKQRWYLNPRSTFIQTTTCKLLLIIQPKRTGCLTYCLYIGVADKSKTCGSHKFYAIRGTLRILFFQLLFKTHVLLLNH